MNLSAGSTVIEHNVKSIRLGTTAIYAAIVVMTMHHWVENTAYTKVNSQGGDMFIHVWRTFPDFSSDF